MVMSTFGIYSSYKLKEKSSKFYPLLIQVPRGKMMTETKPLIASKQRLFYFYFRSQFFSKTSASTRAHQRARTSAERKKEKMTTPENTISNHNALCLSPQNLHKHCLQFLLGPISPKRNWRQCVCKILGWQTKSIMVCYGTFWSGQFPTTAPLHWLSINPLRFIFYHPRSTDFEENIEGCLWTG